MTEKLLDCARKVVLRGVFLSMKYEIPKMLKTGGGTIVNIASVASVIADPGMSPYAAAKHGVVVRPRLLCSTTRDRVSA
nr:SDR family NAD(P)-dependent oxidoreductase [uncultured Cohaesibacter sp.]